MKAGRAKQEKVLIKRGALTRKKKKRGIKKKGGSKEAG